MDSSNLTILISDDSILARKQLKDVISRHVDGVTFVEASNGEEAVEKYEEAHPDLVFLDIVMPKKDGIQATADIIALNASATIVIVSSVGTQSQLRAAIEAGARDFIQKPIDKNQVGKVLASHIGGK